MIDQNFICVSEIGMACSLGRSSADACAAARAGLTRPTHLEYYKVPAAEGSEPLGVVGHAVPFVTLGFESEIRMAQILKAALVDLRSNDSAGSIESSRSAYYVSVSSPDRTKGGVSIYPESAESGAEDEEDEEEEDEDEEDDVDEEGDGPHGQRERSVWDRALTILAEAAGKESSAIAPLLRHVNGVGNSGFAEALQAAAKDIGNGDVDTAIVVSIDTYLDEDSLAWLESLGRLKTPDVAAGTMPGEAGVILVVERHSTAIARGARPRVKLDWIELATDENNFLAGELSTGKVMAELLSICASKVVQNTDQGLWLLVDQTGEVFRASEWGHCLVKIAESNMQLSEPIVWFPAASFGDTGAASGALAMALIGEAIDRRYAPRDSAIILSCNDGPQRSAILIGKL